MKMNSARLRAVNTRSAFTLVEIMMVVLIIGLLLGFAVNQIGGNLVTARETRVKADIQTLSTQLMAYESVNGFLPSSEQGIQALVQQPSSAPVPRSWRQLMKEVPTDPWGREYHYTQPGRHNADGYDIFSSGPDGIPGNADDVGNWKK